jgi:DNA anti-recombination protein RmuC
MLQIDEVKERLKGGEDEFRELIDGDHAIELKVAQRFEQLRMWITETTASRADVKEHERSVSGKLDQIVTSVGELGKRVAVMSDRMERKG